jgi:hypothetical protein
MAKDLTVTYLGQECLIRKDQYVDGRPAISLINKFTGKKVAMATIDASEETAELNYALVKDFGHDQDPLNVLKEVGLLGFIGERITNGFLWVRKCELTI